MRIIFAISIVALLGGCVPVATLAPLALSAADAYKAVKPVVIEIHKLRDAEK